MAYSAATFYIAPDTGSDAARSNLSPSAYANNGSGLVRVTVGSLGTPAVETGSVVDIAGTTSAVYDGAWIITVIDSTTVDLQSSTYSTNPAAKGTLTPRGGSLGDPWLTMTTGGTSTRIAAGDTIRVKKSPNPVDLSVTGKWTQRTYVQGGLSSSTNATPIEVTTQSAHGLATGDYVYITGHSVNTNANGLWKITYVSTTKFTLDGSTGNGVGTTSGLFYDHTGRVVELSAALTKNVEVSTVTAATAANSATCATVDAPTFACKEGYRVQRITLPASPATSTLYAYKALSGATDYSAYDSISFWIYVTSAITANQLTLTLCSDTAGVTAVDTFAIPALPATNVWAIMTLQRNGGGALGNSIQSWALKSGSTTPTGSQQINLNGIVACNASSLHLGALISKNSAAQGGTEPWWCIGGINDKIVMLDANLNVGSREVTRGYYYGTSETVELYKREPFYMAYPTGATTTDWKSQRGGTSETARITYSCGWDFSGTPAQSGETFIDARTGSSYTLAIQNHAYVTVDHMSMVRGNSAAIIQGARTKLTNVQTVCSCGYGIYFSSSSAWSSAQVNSIANCTWGHQMVSGAHGCVLDVTKVTACGTAFTFQAFLQGSIVKNATVWGSGGGNVGFYGSQTQGAIVQNCTTYNNNPIFQMADCGYIVSDTVTMNESTKSFAFSVNYQGARVFVKNYNGTVGDHRVIHEGTATTGSHWQLITSTRPGAAATGKMWKISALGSIHVEGNPAYLVLGSVLCRANQPVTVRAWCKKDHATQVKAQLAVRGGYIAGVSADVKATKADDTNWELLSLNFTPTEDGVAQVEGWGIFVGNTSSVYFDFPEAQ